MSEFSEEDLGPDSQPRAPRSKVDAGDALVVPGVSDDLQAALRELLSQRRALHARPLDPLPEGAHLSSIGVESACRYSWAGGTAWSHPGIRPHTANHDGFLVDETHRLFAVADGAGDDEEAHMAPLYALRTLAHHRDQKTLNPHLLMRHIGGTMVQTARQQNLTVPPSTALSILRVLNETEDAVDIEGIARGDTRILLIDPNGTYEVWEEDDRIEADEAFWSRFFGNESTHASLPDWLQQEILKIAHIDGNPLRNMVSCDPQRNRKSHTTVWRKRVPRGTRFAIMSDGFYKMMLNQELVEALLPRPEMPWDKLNATLLANWMARQTAMRASLKEKIVPISAFWNSPGGQVLAVPLGRLTQKRDGSGFVRATNIDNGTLVTGEL